MIWDGKQKQLTLSDFLAMELNPWKSNYSKEMHAETSNRNMALNVWNVEHGFCVGWIGWRRDCVCFSYSMKLAYTELSIPRSWVLCK